jgi:hypothetical protein
MTSVSPYTGYGWSVPTFKENSIDMIPVPNTVVPQRYIDPSKVPYFCSYLNTMNGDCAFCRSGGECQECAFCKGAMKKFYKDKELTGKLSSEKLTAALNKQKQAQAELPLAEQIIVGDIFLWVTLTISAKDIRPQYVIEDKRFYIDQMINKFTALHDNQSGDWKTKAHAYIVENTQNGMPHVHGLLRWNGSSIMKKKPQPSSKRILLLGSLKDQEGNKITREVNATFLSRFDQSKKCYVAFKHGDQGVVTKYDYMLKMPNVEIVGDTIEKFIN